MYEGGDGEEKANENLRRFVEGHLVVSDGEWKAGEKKTTVGGREIWWEEKEDGRVVMPDHVAVEKVGQRVANGEVVSLFSILYVYTSLIRGSVLLLTRITVDFEGGFELLVRYPRYILFYKGVCLQRSRWGMAR